MVVFVPAVVTVLIAVPMVIVLEPAARALPVTAVIPAFTPSRTYPRSALVGDPGPVTVVPAIVMPHGIPIALHPHKLGSRWRRPYSKDAGCRRTADHNPHRDIRRENRRRGKQQYSQ
jgi:hypothetical protein